MPANMVRVRARGAYPRRFRQVSWWEFGGGSEVAETHDSARVLRPGEKVP